MRTAIMTLALVLSTAAAQAKEKGDRAFGKEEILSTARALAEKVGMPWDKRGTVENRLRSLLEGERWHHKYGGAPIRGVFAYQMGEGGLIVKVKKGRGLVRFKDGRELPLTLKSVTVGAQIGGSSEWGFGLVVGLQDLQYFGGDYSGGTVSATMGGAGTGMMELTRKNAWGPSFHKVYLIGASSGASANAGGGSLEIVVHR